ncbi:MAG: suppressor of fused domain protein [Lachnospiraceae bacterium]|nr:suppressor of fused domain protein [Lachnospiraceae bacterium]
MSGPKILLEEWSPVCNIQAFVEETDKCCYFYLWVKPGMDDAVMKSCWICNVTPAPEELDVEAMKQGIAPAMPGAYVSHDIGGMKLDADLLKIVWFEEGNTAALLLINPRFVPGLEMPDYEPCMDETINLLWGVPITGAEYRFAMEHDIDETLKHVRG